ncbi:MAG: hypothetical protein IJU55_00805 [Selenomonadaceae bacterium]|nr:hypothetical protein [Selenomonadaceae bacterium]
MKLKILPILLIFMLIPLKTFADAPEISSGQSTFNFLKGYYILKDDVTFTMNNRGFKGSIRADEAIVSLITQKCLATGKVTLTQENISLTCDKAYATFNDKNVIVEGNVNFDSKENLKITAEKATYKWDERIADFYGKVKVKTEKNFEIDENLNPNGTFAHVRYNVETNKIIQLDKNFDASKIIIPDFES